MKRSIMLLAFVVLTGCHWVVKPPPLPKHNPLAAPTVSLLPTVTATP